MKNEIEQLNALLDNLKISRNDAEFYKAEKKSMLELVTTREDYLLASAKQEESELIVAGLETQIRTMVLQLNEVMADLPADLATVTKEARAQIATK